MASSVCDLRYLCLWFCVWKLEQIFQTANQSNAFK